MGDFCGGSAGDFNYHLAEIFVAHSTPSHGREFAARFRHRPKRKPNRLKNYDYSQNGAYFVTICAKNRMEIFATIDVGAVALDRPLPPPVAPTVHLTELGKCVEETINIANDNDKNGIKINNYVIMPNHIHLIIVICSETGGPEVLRSNRGRSPLQFMVRNIKSYVSKWAGFGVWQKSFHDHIIRNEEEYYRIDEYIENNPAGWVDDCYYERKIT